MTSPNLTMKGIAASCPLDNVGHNFLPLIMKSEMAGRRQHAVQEFLSRRARGLRDLVEVATAVIKIVGDFVQLSTRIEVV
jgi:hypothetical protein